MTFAPSSLLAALASLPFAFAACGAGNASTPPQQPTASASASGSAAPDPDAAKKAAITIGRAGQIAAAAVAWKRANAGCPTIKDLTDKYTFEPNTENDTSGAPFIIECADTEVRVHSAAGEIVRVEPYTARAPSPPSDPLPHRTAEPAASGADQVMRALSSRFRRCYSAALQNDPNMSGSVHGTVVVASNGTVKAVTIDPTATTVKDPTLIACVTNVIKSAHFDPSTDGSEAHISF